LIREAIAVCGFSACVADIPAAAFQRSCVRL
jgi:hypothetical protein